MITLYPQLIIFNAVDAKPKQGELRTHGVIKNIVANGYSNVGICLLEDDSGTEIRNLEMEHAFSVTKIVEHIFYFWTDGKGGASISWAGLVTCLRSDKLNTLADEIESAYCAEENHEIVHKEEAEGKQKAPPTTYRSGSLMAEGDVKQSHTGFQTELIYVVTATLGTILVATLLYHCCPPSLGIADFNSI